jgi:alkylation response protein AidB-like acyl-CoA dehydrogenase
MDLEFSSQQKAFRHEVRDFLRTSLPPELARTVRSGQVLAKRDYETWHGILYRRGWLAQHWHSQWGGTGWDAVQRYIFEVEAALAHAPPIVQFGIGMLGPVLIKYGSERQRHHWLPRILNGADWWCQGYSEPGAGSDLASLKCMARREGDHYVVDGQKTWTTLAHYANMIFCLVRTDPSAKKQEGISFLLIDLRSPGVEVRPIKLLNGEHEVNEVFFTDVRVPASNLVGEENKGWTYAKYLLSYERSSLANIGRSKAAFRRLDEILLHQRDGERALKDNPGFAMRRAKAAIELRNMEITTLRVLTSAVPGEALAQSAMLKVRGTELLQEITSITRRALGERARCATVLDWADREAIGTELVDSAQVSPEYFNNRKQSIYGGSNEVQREIIAKSILGL